MLLGQVLRADHRSFNKSLSERALVKITLGQSSYGPDPRKPFTCCLFEMSWVMYQGDLRLTVIRVAVEDMFPDKKS